ncbi:B12-binding domain-containing radical SAM protein [Chloroflexota bacterium]
MLNSIPNGKKFHISMSTSEEVLSLKKLAMNIYNEIGVLYEYNQNYDEALNNYDYGAQILNRDDPESSKLIETQDKIYRNIRGLLATNKEKTQYDVLILNVGWADPTMPWPIVVLGTELMKEGKKVRLMDGYSEEYEIIREAGVARLIGFSVMTAQIGPSLRLSRQIKKAYPDKFIVWGGIHPTLFPEQCLQEDSIDFIVSGDGEDALTSLTACLENRSYNFADIPGLGFKNNGAIVVNPMGKPARFEDAGPWKYELLDMEYYMNWHVMLVDSKYPSLSCLATRGCPKGCTFCINSVVQHTRIYRARPVVSVLDEIEQLIRKYHVRTINFPDEAFFINPNYFASFTEGILRRNLNFEWGGTAHIADVLKHKELFLNAKKAGLIWTGGSGESGSNRLLELINKGITVEDTIECSHFLADNGLMTGNCFMTHLPTETPEETKATLDLMEHIKSIFRAKNNPAYIMGPSVFRPYPGSKLYNMCVESGFKQPETLEEWGRMILPDGHFNLDNMPWYGGGS